MAPGRRLFLSGLVLTACVAVWVVQGDQTARVASHLAVYAAAFAAYLVAAHAGPQAGRRTVGWALGAAVAWRIALVLAPPLLSDDVYRSVWEGRIQNHGGNPYTWMDRPEAERWIALRDESVWSRVNHKDYTAIYPPLWHMAARGVALVSDTVTAMKGFLVGCELLTLAGLAAGLCRAGLPPGRLLILAWSPLALVEIAGSGHNEAFGMMFLAASLVLLERGHTLASALAAALGAQAKVLPALVAAAWTRRYRPWEIVAAAALGALLVVPYASAGAGLWNSFGKLGQFWRFNETAFALVAAVAPSHEMAVVISSVIVVLTALGLAAARTPPVEAAFAVIVVILALSPNVLPWYALWLLPLLVFKDVPAALLFTGTVQIAYLVYPSWHAGARWHIGWDVRALEYGPCLVLAAWSWVRGQARHRRVAAA